MIVNIYAMNINLKINLVLKFNAMNMSQNIIGNLLKNVISLLL
jgi:hypothetical protein